MGYSTDFHGKLILSSKLDEVSEFNAFCEQRHGGNLEPFEGMPGLYCDWEPTVKPFTGTVEKNLIKWKNGSQF